MGKGNLMRLLLPSIGASALLVSQLLWASDASACGGCFPPPSAEPSQVVGHRMIVSLSNEKTTLWDQITYTGEPESFAWVLPIHGQVDIALSSDALFGVLEEATKVYVYAQPPPCAADGCPSTNSGSTFTSSTSSGSGGVTVIATETVGPYETVQLSSTDPAALSTWLETHGYDIPNDISPVIADYVNEGFNFLALKLVPGQGVNSMRPVRITTMGAGLSLPLRMVAAGTGAITPITLWIAAEGRYEPKNFGSFEIPGSEITYDWDSFTSDLGTVKQAHFDTDKKAAWLTEMAEPRHPQSTFGNLPNQVAAFPDVSGYDPDPVIAEQECLDDLDALYGSLSANDFWLTRIHARLPREALTKDLDLGAHASQKEVSSYIIAEKTKGTYPCPTPCNTGGNGGNGGNGNGGFAGWLGFGEGGSGAGNNGDDPGGGNSGCSTSGGSKEVPVGAALLALGLALATRRRRSA